SVQSPVIMLPTPDTSVHHTLSLHDALPIFPPITDASTRSRSQRHGARGLPSPRSSSARGSVAGGSGRRSSSGGVQRASASSAARSEEHTSELQSRVELVCRLLLENKNINIV